MRVGSWWQFFFIFLFFTLFRLFGLMGWEGEGGVRHLSGQRMITMRVSYKTMGMGGVIYLSKAGIS